MVRVLTLLSNVVISERIVEQEVPRSTSTGAAEMEVARRRVRAEKKRMIVDSDKVQVMVVQVYEYGDLKG